jgi:cell division protein FtsN
MKQQQRGGTFLGLVIGVVVGLGAALAVAVYVTKVPIPFVNKSQSRSADQDDAEAQKNKNWDPNAPLYGKNPSKISPSATQITGATGASVDPKPSLDAKSEAKPNVKADARADANPETKAAVTADPLGDLVKAKSGTGDPFAYFVQLGAFRTQEDAEAHRAKLSLSGVETKISEREQSGAKVFRVRVGPFDKKDEAEKAKENLDKAGLDTALVRVQR